MFNDNNVPLIVIIMCKKQTITLCCDTESFLNVLELVLHLQNTQTRSALPSPTDSNSTSNGGFFPREYSGRGV
jgi:hypothetical protein